MRWKASKNIMCNITKIFRTETGQPYIFGYSIIYSKTKHSDNYNNKNDCNSCHLHSVGT